MSLNGLLKKPFLLLNVSLNLHKRLEILNTRHIDAKIISKLFIPGLILLFILFFPDAVNPNIPLNFFFIVFRGDPCAI